MNIAHLESPDRAAELRHADAEDQYIQSFCKITADDVVERIGDDSPDVMSDLLNKRKTVDQVLDEWRHLIAEDAA